VESLYELFQSAISDSSINRKEGTVLTQTKHSLEALELAQNIFKRSVKTKGEDILVSIIGCSEM